MNNYHVISGKTDIYAILGDPVSHSLSPVIHNSAFKYENLDKVFIALKTGKENLKLAMEMVRTFSIKGLSVTMPLKEEILQYLDKLSPEAQLIGAVNCINNENGILTGYNTDSRGFGLSLLAKYNRYPSIAFVFGAGGVAKAVAVELAMNKVKKIYITNRNFERAKSLEDKLSFFKETNVEVIQWEDVKWNNALNESDLIVNCTSLGMNNKGDLSLLVPWDKVRKDAIIYETVYEPLETTFLKKARSLNLDTIAGINLLIYQAAVAFEIWTGKVAPLKIMEQSVVNFLNSKEN
ncbi:MAG TPA: shikimate dehydrogenase [Thermoanaerobacterales bacterium]|nr:shikimate dehydrogenase [Thermoanaerobacterales bacterium]